MFSSTPRPGWTRTVKMISSASMAVRNLIVMQVSSGYTSIFYLLNDSFLSAEAVYFISFPLNRFSSFISPNADFTPSRGNTPVHPSFMGTPQVRKTPTITTDKAPASVPEPSPNTKKKRLAELFRDSFGGSEEAPVAAADGDESKASPDKRTSKPPKPSSTTILDVLPGSEHGTPYISGANSLCNSERLPNEPDHKQKLGRLVQHRCLPSLMSCRISVDRKKKTAPAIPVYD